MSGGKKAWESIKKNTTGFVEKPWTTLDAGTVLKKGFEDTGTLMTPDIPMPEEAPIIPIPDENVAAIEARRRRAKSSRTGRDSTILTEGLGG